MNPDDIPPPGPERDALVAERVMGWTRLNGAPEGQFCLEREDRGEDKHGGLWWRSPAGDSYCGLCEPLPEWSTDIAAAWQVVEKIHGQVTRGVLVNYTADIGCYDVLYYCSIYSMNPSVPDGPSCWGATAPDAITKAALLTCAKGESDKSHRP